MAKQDNGILDKFQNLLQQDYRGVNVRTLSSTALESETCRIQIKLFLQIAVYAIATAGLAYSIHKIRPVKHCFLAIID